MAGAAAAALAAGTAATADPQLAVTGSISVPGGGTYSSSADDQPVNIEPYVSDTVSNSSGFIHAYADPGGVFGARASGQGVYDVSASATISGTLYNSSGVTQMAVLNYDLSAGDVYVQGSGNATASLSFTILADSAPVGVATLQEAMVNGLETQHSAMSDISGFSYSPYVGGLGYYVPDQSGVVDLGLVGPGDSLTYSYSITSEVTGTYDPTTYSLVTEYEYIPEGPYYTQTICASDALEASVVGVGTCYGGATETVIVPTAYIEEPIEVLVPDSPNDYAEARSGDPLNVGFGNGQNGGQGFNTTPFGGGSMASGGFTAVPEPSTYALIAAGLGLVRIAAGRRKGGSRRQDPSEASQNSADACAGSRASA